MIQLIGLMMGAYIFTRCIEMLTSKEQNWAVSICALITILVVIISIIGLLLSGSTSKY
jgi:hypothetical protein